MTIGQQKQFNMAGQYPDRIKALPLQIGKVDTSGKHKLEAKDCNILFANYKAGTSIPLHKHDNADIHGVVTKGEIILTLDGETKKYGVGDWYHIPINTGHATRFETETDEIEFWFKPNN